MRSNFLSLVLIVSASYHTGCKAQQPFGESYLKIHTIIPLPNVRRRIDHLDINLENEVIYVAALGNNTVEIVALKEGKDIHSIGALNEPQGVCYIPGKHELFIANGGRGDGDFFDASTFKKTGSVHLPSDADDVRYDRVHAKIYVGYGDGGIAEIDANTRLQTGNVSLPAHPEGFQLDLPGNAILVNVPEKNMIGIIDLTRLQLIHKWTRSAPTANFPMAFDNKQRYAFIGYRRPAKLIVIDAKSGNSISSNDMVDDADDLYFDNEKKRVYVSGGGGFINIFQQDGSLFKQVANIPTRSGARTSLFIAELKMFVVAEPAAGGKPAQLLVYDVVR